MSCIENINRYIIPNDIITSLTKVYKYIGKNEVYEDITKSSINKILDQTLQRDAYFLSKILSTTLTDARLKLIISKNSAPKNREEATLCNLIEVLADIQENYKKYDYRSNDQLNMINYIYQSQNIKYDAKELINNRSKRLLIDDLTEIVYSNKNNIESINLYTNYFIDLFNIKPFTQKNLSAALITLYILLLKSDLQAFKYVSFFEMIYNNYNEFNDRLLDVSYNWKEGISQPTSFIRFILNVIIEAYEKADSLVKCNVQGSSNKQNNIEKEGLILPI